MFFVSKETQGASDVYIFGKECEAISYFSNELVNSYNDSYYNKEGMNMFYSEEGELEEAIKRGWSYLCSGLKISLGKCSYCRYFNKEGKNENDERD